MKSSLLIFIAFLSLTLSNKLDSSIIPKIQCLINNDVLYDYLVDFIEIVKTKDFKTIIEALKEAYPIVKEEILKCLKKEIELFSAKKKDPKKKPLTPTQTPEEKKCIGDCYRGCAHIKKHFEYVMCADDCIKKNCKKK